MEEFIGDSIKPTKPTHILAANGKKVPFIFKQWKGNWKFKLIVASVISNLVRNLFGRYKTYFAFITFYSLFLYRLKDFQQALCSKLIAIYCRNRFYEDKFGHVYFSTNFAFSRIFADQRRTWHILLKYIRIKRHL